MLLKSKVEKHKGIKSNPWDLQVAVCLFRLSHEIIYAFSDVTACYSCHHYVHDDNHYGWYDYP